jgi:hypothetical protein
MRDVPIVTVELNVQAAETVAVPSNVVADMVAFPCPEPWSWPVDPTASVRRLLYCVAVANSPELTVDDTTAI